MEDQEILLSIEYHTDNHPFYVITTNGEYEVDYSKGYGYLWHRNSSHKSDEQFEYSNAHGYDGDWRPTLWVNPEFGLISSETKLPTTVDELGYIHAEQMLIPEDEDGYPVKTWDDFTSVYNASQVEGVVYCQICEDLFPDDNECEHIYWHPDGYHAGIGVYKDEYKEDAAKQEVLAFVQVLTAVIVDGKFRKPELMVRADYEGDEPKPSDYVQSKQRVEALLQTLREKTWDIHLASDMLSQNVYFYTGYNDGNRFDFRRTCEFALSHHDEDGCYGGFGWFFGLDKDKDGQPSRTEKHRELTIKWVEEWAATVELYDEDEPKA